MYNGSKIESIHRRAHGLRRDISENRLEAETSLGTTRVRVSVLWAPEDLIPPLKAVCSVNAPPNPSLNPATGRHVELNTFHPPLHLI